MPTVELPYVKTVDPKRRRTLTKVAELQRNGDLPEWAKAACKDVVAGVSWAEAAKRQGKTEWALRKLFAPPEKVAERNRRRAAWSKERRAKMSPEERKLANLRAQARVEAREKGVPATQVYEEWGLLKV